MKEHAHVPKWLREPPAERLFGGSNVTFLFLEKRKNTTKKEKNYKQKRKKL